MVSLLHSKVEGVPAGALPGGGRLGKHTSGLGRQWPWGCHCALGRSATAGFSSRTINKTAAYVANDVVYRCANRQEQAGPLPFPTASHTDTPNQATADVELMAAAAASGGTSARPGRGGPTHLTPVGWGAGNQLDSFVMRMSRGPRCTP